MFAKFNDHYTQLCCLDLQKHNHHNHYDHPIYPCAITIRAFKKSLKTPWESINFVPNFLFWKILKYEKKSSITKNYSFAQNFKRSFNKFLFFFRFFSLTHHIKSLNCLFIYFYIHFIHLRLKYVFEKKKFINLSSRFFTIFSLTRHLLKTKPKKLKKSKLKLWDMWSFKNVIK